MTKLEELKAAYEAAEADCYAAEADCYAACNTFEAAVVAYSNADYAFEAELKKQENSNDI
jgi:hypothetical protein